jgi:L-seryl-tRNA(Ser) seleniumtransferase
MRVDKLILAALAATLRLYRDVPTAEESLPLLARLSAPFENLRNRAERLAPQLAAAPAIGQAEVIEGKTYLGGGSVPTQQIPTWCVALTPHEMNVDELSKRLRMGTPAVVGRIQQDRLLLDLRSVLPHQDSAIVEAAGRIANEGKTKTSVESA